MTDRPETIEQIKERLARQDRQRDPREHESVKEAEARIARREAEVRKGEEEAQQRVEEERREKRAAEMESLKNGNRRRYVEAGGTEAEFEAAWPGIKAEIIKRRVLSAEAEARAASAALVRETF